jgi:hypothetical protein
MTAETIRIEGPPEVLEGLRQDLLEEAGDQVDVEPVSVAVPGELREPLVVAILVALSPVTAVGIRTVGSIIERRMTHAERKDLLQIYREKDGIQLSVEDLFNDSSGDGG